MKRCKQETIIFSDEELKEIIQIYLEERLFISIASITNICFNLEIKYLKDDLGNGFPHAEFKSTTCTINHNLE